MVLLSKRQENNQLVIRGWKEANGNPVVIQIPRGVAGWGWQCMKPYPALPWRTSLQGRCGVGYLIVRTLFCWLLALTTGHEVLQHYPWTPDTRHHDTPRPSRHPAGHLWFQGIPASLKTCSGMTNITAQGAQSLSTYTAYGQRNSSCPAELWSNGRSV